jgi:phage-related protein
MEVGRIDLGLDVNQKSFNRQLNGLAGGAEKGVKSAFSGLGTKIGFTLGIAAIASFTKSCLSLGSSLTEVQNVVDTVFPKMNGQVNSFAVNAMEQFGLSETIAKKYMGTLGAMSKSMGFSEQAALSMAEGITGLSGDVASFYNMSSDEAYTKLKSIWTGETESLKELGVIMTQTNLDQYAMNNGFGKTTSSMDEQTKTMLRYQYVTSALSAAQGDFAKTSGSWANQVRVLGLRFDSLKATLGQGLINLFTPLIQGLNSLIGKLQGAANAFKSFTELVTGKKIETSTGATANNALEATENILGMGDAAETSAKKAAKALAGFDQVNNLAGKDASSGSSSGATSVVPGSAGTGSGLASDVATGIEESSGRMLTALDKVKSKLNELTELFKKGFTIGLGDNNLGTISDNIDSIKKSVKGIFTDPAVLTSANSWADSMALSLGKITGSFASVGLTAAEFFTGSISTYLSQNSGFIKEKLISLFDLSAERATIYSNFTTAMADIYTVFRGDNAKQIGADLIAIFSNSFLSLVTLSLQFGNDLMAAITKPIIENKDAIKTALDNTLGIISEIVGGIKDFISNAFVSIKSSYDTYIAPALDKFSSGFSTVFSAVLDAYNTYLAPVIQSIAEKFRELINGPIAELVQSITDFIGKIVDGVATIWEKTLAPLLAWLVETLAPGFSEAIGVVADVFLGVWGTVSTVASDIIDALGGIVDFLVGVFTGDWEKAWGGIKTFFGGIIQGIKDLVIPIANFFKTQFTKAWTNIKNAFSSVGSFFGGIWDTIKTKFTSIGTMIGDAIGGAFKTAVNAVFATVENVINAPIKAINALIDVINEVPGIDIGELSTFNLPRLAQGGYVGANQPQLALIGDNRREGEIVAPESKITEAVRRAGASGGLTKQDIKAAFIEAIRESGLGHIYIGDEDLARHVNNGNEMLDLRYSPVKR